MAKTIDKEALTKELGLGDGSSVVLARTERRGVANDEELARLFEVVHAVPTR
jgi:hypothetical protein